MLSNAQNSQLEEAYRQLNGDVSKAIISVLIQSTDGRGAIFLIAKHPNEYTYFGILTTEFTNGRKLTQIPLENINAIGGISIPITPFLCQPFIDDYKIEYIMNPIVERFEKDKQFRKDIISFHHDKSLEYIALRKDDIIFKLGLSAGMDSVPMAIATTPKINSNSQGQPHQETGFLNLPTYTNIIELFPLLTQFCYQPKNIDDLYQKMNESGNHQILALRDNLQSRCSPKKLEELVVLLNRAESAPKNINPDKIENFSIAALNPIIYMKYLKNYIKDNN